jgi:hypothetical protein
VGSLGGDSGEEGNSGEVVMLGREEVVTRPSSGCVPPRTSFRLFPLAPPLTQISTFNTNFVFHPLDKEPCWQGVALTALPTSFQTCTSLDSGVVLEFESARSNLVDYVMSYD